MQAGMKREWARPMDPNAQGAKPYGNWKGKGEIWNIVGRQQGFHYALANDTTVNALLFRGYKICCPPEDPERFLGYGRILDRGGHTTKEMKVGPYYLLKIPSHLYIEMRRRRAQERLAGMDIPTKTILSRNPIEAQTLAGRQPKYLPRDGNVFFRDPDHGENGYTQMEVTRGQE